MARVLNKQRRLFDFIWSDPHFGHRNVIKYSGRPFMDVDDMTEKLIANYNSVVGPEDTCLWVGDCFFLSNKKAIDIMDRLNGKKILVKGNHDPTDSQCMKRGFESVVHEMKVYIQGHPVRISHYPYWPDFWTELKLKWKGYKSTLRYPERRPPKIKGEILLHGHTHSNIKVNGNCVCACVEAWNYKPFRVEELEKIVNTIKKEQNNKEIKDESKQ